MPIFPLWPIRANVDGVSQYEKEKILRFVDSVNDSIPHINQLIDSYTKETDPEEKISLLKQLHREVESLYAKGFDKAISRSIDYVFHIQKVLFYGIQEEFKALGFPSIQRDALNESRRELSHPESPAEIIANMLPEKASKLAEILSSGKGLDKDRLSALYEVGEAGKEAFDDFLSKYSIECFSDVNSKNFILTRIETTLKERCVLKLEDRLGMSSEMEARLRETELQGVLAPISADRQVTYAVSDNEFVTRRLVVTEYYDGKDLTQHAKKHVDDEARLDSAIKIYTEMADILTRMEAEGCAFPDMKNANWLIDKNGHLRISDTKTFLPIRENGSLDTGGDTPLSTSFMGPPEICFFSVQADKMHSYLYAKDLYQYLTGAPSEYFFVDPDNLFSDLKTVDELDFNLPVFQTERGQLLAPLIKDMMLERPAKNRQSIEAASALLKNMQTPRAHQSLTQAIESFDEFKTKAQEQAQTAPNDGRASPKGVDSLEDDSPNPTT